MCVNAHAGHTHKMKQLKVKHLMDAIGINSYSHFNKMFVKIVGISASDYIKKRDFQNEKLDEFN